MAFIKINPRKLTANQIFDQLEELEEFCQEQGFRYDKDFVIAPLMLGMYVVLFGNNITKSNKEKITVITGLTRSVV